MSDIKHAFVYCVGCDSLTEHDFDGRCFNCLFILPHRNPRTPDEQFAAGIAKLRQVVAETPEWHPEFPDKSINP